MRTRGSFAATLVAVLALAAGSGGLLASGNAVASPAPSGPACAGASTGVVDQIDDGIAHEIYEQELMSTEVSADLYRVTNSAALGNALASGDQATILAATHMLVYTPVWHIVRLRVFSPSGQLLADVGGPDVLAPVSGQVTYEGKLVGSFVMSVQDDRGYKKLVGHIADVPIEEYLRGKPLMGTLAHPPSQPPASGPLTLGRIHYSVDAYSVDAFPTGSLQIALLVPVPSSAQSAMSCQELRLQTNAGIVERVATGLTLSGHDILGNQRLFVLQAYVYTHLPVFMFKGTHEAFGTNRLNGVTAPAPPTLSKGGEVRYDGSSWLVAALRPYPPDWIYVLEPATESGSTGSTASTGSSGSTGAM